MFPRRVLVSFFLPFLLLTTLLLAYAQEALFKDLNSKAVKLYSEGRYSEAAEVAREAVKVAVKTFGPDHPAVAASLDFLGVVYRAQGRDAEAEAAVARARRDPASVYRLTPSMEAFGMVFFGLLFYIMVPLFLILILVGVAKGSGLQSSQDPTEHTPEDLSGQNPRICRERWCSENYVSNLLRK